MAEKAADLTCKIDGGLQDVNEACPSRLFRVPLHIAVINRVLRPVITLVGIQSSALLWVFASQSRSCCLQQAIV